MRKRFTKIICAAVATISAFSLMLAPACTSYTRSGVEADTSADKVTSNGGFLAETGDYVYFVNGVAANTDDNTFGEVVKGSIQRISKADLAQGNYQSAQTIVPLVVYSGSYEAGIYIYGDYIYYTTPSIERNADGEILNSYLDFKRTKLDGSETMTDYFFQSTNNSIDYRYVEVDGEVYILYALSETLYGSSSTTNIHSVKCSTKENTLLAYNVSAYAFDTEDPENPCAYYTMGVTQYLGTDNSISMSYNQLYRVSADVTESPRTYDFSDVEDYDPETDPLYVNYGDFVFDGIGRTQIETEGRVTQYNYAYWNEDAQYDINNSEYTYSIKSYKDGELLFTRVSSTGSSSGNLYALDDSQVDADSDGKVDERWDAVTRNAAMSPRLYGSDTNSYEYVTIDGKLYAILTSADGITKGEVIDGKVENTFTISSDASATILAIREEANSETESHLNMYYSITGGNGYTVYRIAIDGDSDDYNKLPSEPEWNTTWTYRGVRVLDLDAVSSWYLPEFVGNTLFFASEISNMADYNYIMACDLSKDGYMMTNAQINAYNEQFEAVNDKIYDYNDETNADGTEAYKNLADALKYLYYTGDSEYLAELIQAYVDIQGKDEEYLYSKASAEIYLDYANVEGDWADYADDYKMINGTKVYANFSDYYYTVVGVMSDEDKDALRDSYRAEFMQTYPEDTSTWWEKLSTVAKVFFIIGVSVAGLAVIAGITVLTIWLIRRRRVKKTEGGQRMFVDITDDDKIDVYGDDQNN